MKIRCPNCGSPVIVNGFGRKPLGIRFIKVCEALQHGSTVSAAAEILDCSVAYIYKVCKLRGKMPKEYMERLAVFLSKNKNRFGK
jgi:hypothetical protein